MNKYTLAQIIKAWDATYGENMREEYPGFIQRLFEEKIERKIMLKVIAVFSVTITMSLSIYLFSYDIFNVSHVAWIHYIIPFSVGVVFAASSIMMYVENS